VKQLLHLVFVFTQAVILAMINSYANGTNSNANCIIVNVSNSITKAIKLSASATNRTAKHVCEIFLLVGSFTMLSCHL